MSNRPVIRLAFSRKGVDWSKLSLFNKQHLGGWLRIRQDDSYMYEHARPDADDIARADDEARAQP